MKKRTRIMGEKELTIYIYTYRCTNGASCRYIEKRSGVKHSQIICPKCGHIMVLIDTEKMN